MTMDQRQDLTPEMQIFLIATDVDEVKTMVGKLEGTVSQIHISLVGEKDKPGVFEELRALSRHAHPEIEALRLELRVFTAKVGAAVATVIVAADVAFRFFWGGSK